ncbi:MAG: aminoacylase, partial [Candidatus Rokuibacteriota bacterium]
MAHDLVIKNGMVVDGSGFSRYRADVGVKDGKIVEIGKIRSSAAATIDAEGLFVAPGIID